MKENRSSAHFCRITPMEKEVACNKLEMHVLRFYSVGQNKYLMMQFPSFQYLVFIDIFLCDPYS